MTAEKGSTAKAAPTRTAENQHEMNNTAVANSNKNKAKFVNPETYLFMLMKYL
jgi:hypothetical protein